MKALYILFILLILFTGCKTIEKEKHSLCECQENFELILTVKGTDITIVKDCVKDYIFNGEKYLKQHSCWDEAWHDRVSIEDFLVRASTCNCYNLSETSRDRMIKRAINSVIENEKDNSDINENEINTNVSFEREENCSDLIEQSVSLEKTGKNIIGFINVDNLNFRSSPDFSNNIIKELQYGTSLKVIEKIEFDSENYNSNCLLKDNFEIKYNQNNIVLKKNKRLRVVDLQRSKKGETLLTCEVEINDKNIQFLINEEFVEPIIQENWLKIIVDNQTGYVYEKFVTVNELN